MPFFVVDRNPLAFDARAFFIRFSDQAAALDFMVDQLFMADMGPDNLFDANRPPSRHFILGAWVRSPSQSTATSRFSGSYILGSSR